MHWDWRPSKGLLRLTGHTELSARRRKTITSLSSSSYTISLTNNTFLLQPERKASSSTRAARFTFAMTSWVRMDSGDLGLWGIFFSLHATHTRDVGFKFYKFGREQKLQWVPVHVLHCYKSRLYRMIYQTDVSLLCHIFGLLYDIWSIYMKSSITKRYMYLWGFPLFSQASVFHVLVLLCCLRQNLDSFGFNRIVIIMI